MRKVARLQGVSRSIQKAFIAVWVEHKHLFWRSAIARYAPLHCGYLMPGGYKKPMILYRGSKVGRRRIHGFSWTTDLKVAREFARKNTIPPLGEGQFNL